MKPIDVTLILISFIIFLFIVTSEISSLIKFILSMIILAASGFVIKASTKSEGDHGFVILKIKEGIKLIEKAGEKFGSILTTACDVGLVMAFGFSAKFAFPHIKTKTFIASMIIFFLYSFVILPYLPVITLSFFEVPLEKEEVSGGMTMVFAAITILFGYVGITITGLIQRGISIIISVINFLLLGIIPATKPGLQFVIPGITLPLVEGIIAIAILMIVHEVAHGVAARLARIRIKSTGILTFGFIPIGAFCDIDEKQLDKKDKEKIAMVAVAGSTANFLTTFVFFIPFLLLFTMLPYFLKEEVIIIGMEKNISSLINGTRILAINGIGIKNLSDFDNATESIEPNSTVNITTDSGTATVRSDENGKVGIIVKQPMKEEYAAVDFLFTTLSLTVLLNFLVGLINLLSLPLFDGHRLFKIAIKNEFVVNVISAIILIAFLLNIVPWAWQ